MAFTVAIVLFAVLAVGLALEEAVGGSRSKVEGVHSVAVEHPVVAGSERESRHFGFHGGFGRHYGGYGGWGGWGGYGGWGSYGGWGGYGGWGYPGWGWGGGWYGR